jgi:hypothetical protein
MSWFYSSPISDVDRGRQAMTIFHNRSVEYPAYTYDFDTMLTKIGGTDPQYFLEGLGLAISSNEASDGQVQDAMENLADQAQGRLPVKQDFFNALTNRLTTLTTLDYIAATPEIAGQTALDAVKGAQAIGDAVIDTGQSLLVIGPLLIVAAVIFIGYSHTRRLAGR